MKRQGSHLLLGLLAISLFFNAWQHQSQRKVSNKPPVFDKKAQKPTLTPKVIKSQPSQCPFQLKDCQQRSWKMAARLLEATFVRMAQQRREEEQRRVPENSVPKTEPSSNTLAENSIVNDASWKAQKAALCSTAQQHLREHLQRQQSNLKKAFQHAVKHPDQWKKHVERDLKSMQQALKLSELDLSHIRGDYATMYRSHFSQLRTLLKEPSPNWTQVTKGALKLFKAQDSFIKNSLGDDARRKYRVAQLKARTALLAILRQLAGKDWKQGMAW